MNAMLILLVSIVVLVCGYIFYGGWLAKQWGVDPNRETPAHEMEDSISICTVRSPTFCKRPLVRERTIEPTNWMHRSSATSCTMRWRHGETAT